MGPKGLNLIVKSREKCVICGSRNMSELLKIKNFPIYMGCTNSNPESDLFVDQEWILCEECGCSQLVKLLDPSLLYMYNHSSGAIGNTWKKHHEAFAEFIAKWEPKNICEIGGAHGYLANIILDTNPEIKYFMIEPDPSAFDKRVEYLKGFVENNLDKISSYDHIIHSHVLEHIYDPITFLKQIAAQMKPEAKMHISIPNIEELINTKGTNSLNFEHTYYLHMNQLRVILENIGFQILQILNFEKHSFFLTLQKNRHITLQKIPNIHEYSMKFKELIDEVKEFSSEINSLLEENKKIYLFGAHVFSQSIYMEITSTNKKLLNVIDNAASKQGFRLYGTNMHVYSPEVLRDQENVIVALRASHYQEEVRSQLLSINSNLKIVE